VPYGLDLAVRLNMDAPIARVESPSHPVSVSINGRDATVTLSQRDAALDRDFVLSVETAGLDVPHARVERDEDGGESIVVTFVPALGDAETAGEIVFLVDRSGSMAGQSIAEVRNALQLCLRSMIPGCFFNIVGFGSRFERLFPESRAYDERSLEAASQHVSGLNADLGGTEILPALEAVLAQPRHGTLTRQVVVLTDGQVTNTDAVLALAKQHAAAARIFTFGIGAAASQHLVKGLARAGGGIAEFIYPGERIEPKVVRQFGRLLSPALTNVRMDWGGLDVVQAPSVLPPVFSGGRVLLYGFVKQGHQAATARARLSADAPSGTVTFELPIDRASVSSGRTVATFAARARIRELEESPEWTTGRGSRQSHRKTSAVTQEIIALSTRYGVISRETSFVAIERRETPVHGDIQLRRVPIALTTGWGGLDEQVIRPGLRLRVGDPIAPAAAAPTTQAQAFLGFRSKSQRALASFEQGSEAVPLQFAAPDFAAAFAPSTPAGMHALVLLQRADGSWDLTREFARAMDQALGNLESALAGATGSRDEVRKAWATALALAWLERHAGDAEPEWRMLAAKARKWLDHVKASPSGGGGWTNAAAKFLEAK
jgi:Ca-activated chloride channel family protein